MDIFCRNCGRSLTPDDHFCPQCGKPISSSTLGFHAPSNAPTIPALPFQNTPPIPSTDYGSNPYGVTASNPYDASSLKPPPPPRPHRNRRLIILIGIGLLVLLLGNISAWVVFIHGTQTNTNTISSTATTISNGTLLYTADWSNGLNGWTGTSDWTVLNGMLHNDGTNSGPESPASILAPYNLSNISNYEIKATIQIINQGVSPGFNFFARYTDEKNQGYAIVLTTDCGNSDHLVKVAIWLATSWCSPIGNVSFEPNHAEYTYDVMVKDDHIKVSINGSLLVDVTDNRYLSGNRIGLGDHNTQLNISSFKVFAL